MEEHGTTSGSELHYKIIWLTGLPCSGKTTLAKAMVKEFEKLGHPVEMLDGDLLRNSDFSAGAGFDRESRIRHLLRVGYLALRLRRYAYVVCAFVSPYEDVRRRLPIDVLVHVDCLPSVCAERDVKGMWKKAMRGEIKDFTGWDALYETPQKPSVEVLTSALSVEECTESIMRAVFLK